MNRWQGWIIVAGLAMFGGCAGMQTQPETAAGQAQHVVVCWLKPGGDREAVLHAANDFARLPGVLDVRAGYKLSADVPTADSSYDIALVVTFKDGTALRAAENSAAMRGIADGVFKDNLSKSVIYDSVLQNYQVGKVFTEENMAATRARRAAAMKTQQQQIGNAK